METDDGKSLERWALLLLVGWHCGRKEQLWSSGLSEEERAEICEDPVVLH